MKDNFLKNMKHTESLFVELLFFKRNEQQKTLEVKKGEWIKQSNKKHVFLYSLS